MSIDWDELDRRMVAIADTRIQLAMPSSPTTVKRRGVVDQVDATTRTYSAFLDGASVATPNIPYPWGAIPVSGNEIEVDWRPEDGYVVTSAVLGRSPEVTTPDLSGLATDQELSDHAALTIHLLSYNTKNTLATDANKWSMIAFGELDAQFDQVVATVLLDGNGGQSATFTRGILRLRLKQQSVFGNEPLIVLELADSAGITAADIALVVRDHAGPTTYELYVRLTRPYEWMSFIPLWTETVGASHTWLGCADFSASLPTGTVYKADVLALRQEVRPLSADISTNSTLFVDAVGLSFAVKNGGNYSFSFLLDLKVGSTATGAAIGFHHPGGNARMLVEYFGQSTETGSKKESVKDNDSASGMGSFDQANVTRWVFIKGRYNATADGTFQLRYKRTGTSSSVTIQAGSDGDYGVSRVN